MTHRALPRRDTISTEAGPLYLLSSPHSCYRVAATIPGERASIFHITRDATCHQFAIMCGHQRNQWWAWFYARDPALVQLLERILCRGREPVRIKGPLAETVLLDAWFARPLLVPLSQPGDEALVQLRFRCNHVPPEVFLEMPVLPPRVATTIVAYAFHRLRSVHVSRLEVGGEQLDPQIAQCLNGLDPIVPLRQQ